jgi:hypothetical protein
MAERLGRLSGCVVGEIGAGALIGFGLLIVLLSSLVWWLNQFAGRLASPSLGATTFLALLLGWLLARSRVSGGWAAILAALAGLLAIAGLAGGLFSPLLALAQAASSLSSAVRHWQPGQPLPDSSLTMLLAQDLGLRLADMWQRVYLWVGGLLRGAPGFDPLAAGLVWGLLLWGAAVWAAWGVRRLGQPLLAALPAMAILAASLAFAREQLLYLLPPFAAVLGLLAWNQHARRSQDWQRKGVDFAADIPYDLTLWTGAIVVIVSGLAMLAATPSPHQALRLTRLLLVERGQAAEGLGQSLGLSPGPGDVQVVGQGGLLPRQHLLGSGPELSQRVAYLARVLEPPGDGGYYWRAVTYDEYDGRGWKTSPTSAARYPAAGGPAMPQAQSRYLWIEQEIQSVGDAGLQVIQAGDLVRLDQPFEMDLRLVPPGELDPFAASLQQPPSGGNYLAVSRLNAPDEAALAAASYDYPLWIAARYLALPSDLPPRVPELAREITAGSARPYERARLIETYLRLLPYRLDLPAPPPGRDVADYFLFDLRTGYCDYYATAMAVMARSVGLPSRLVVGYAPGHYDAASGRVVITEAEAHSWPEIYFSGVGWVAFEPTGGRSLSALPAAEAQPLALEPPALNPTPTQAAPDELLWRAMGGLALVVVVIWGWISWRSRRRGRAQALAALYAGMRRAARRLGGPDWPGLTPGEVAVSLALQVARLAPLGHLGNAIAPAGGEAQRLAALYARAIYSPHPPDIADMHEAESIWRKLRWRLWLTILTRRTATAIPSRRRSRRPPS